ncbi:MAG: hypothetical protein WCK64_10160 [Synechococcaceae cyanobacterium ELA445]
MFRLPLRLTVLTLLGLLGVAGLIGLSLQPPLASRTGEATNRLLADLEAQEALQDSRERAAVTLDRFVGGEITRYVWGGFTPYLDVIGLEPPDDLAPKVVEGDSSIELRLSPAEGRELYVGRVEAFDGAPRAVTCRGEGTPGAFQRSSGRLRCPEGWTELERPKRRKG